MKEITSDVTFLGMSCCDVQYSCLSSCICDILLGLTVSFSLIFARFSHVSFKSQIGLFPQIQKRL